MAAWVLVLLLIVVFRPAITVLLVAALLLAGPPGGCLGGVVGAVVLPGAGLLVGLCSCGFRSLCQFISSGQVSH